MKCLIQLILFLCFTDCAIAAWPGLCTKIYYIEFSYMGISSNGSYFSPVWSVNAGTGEVVIGSPSVINSGGIAFSLFYVYTMYYESGRWNMQNMQSGYYPNGTTGIGTKTSGGPETHTEDSSCSNQCPPRPPGGYWGHHPGSNYNSLIIQGESEMNPDCIVPPCTVMETEDNNGFCERKTCPYPNQVLEQNGVCQDPTCPPGQELYNHTCVVKCDEWQVRDANGVCQTSCPIGFEKVNDTCLPVCGAREHREVSTNQCINNCKDQMVQAAKTCPSGLYTMTDTCSFTCDNCTSAIQKCVDACASKGGTQTNTCSGSTVSCECKNPAPTDKPNPNITEGEKNTSSTETKPDGTKTTTDTKVVTTSDGTETTTTTTTTYNANGTVNGTPQVTTTTKTGTGTGGPPATQTGDISGIGTGDTNSDGTCDPSKDPSCQDTGSDATLDPTAISCPPGEVCIGDGVCQPGESPWSSDCAGTDYLNTRYTELKAGIAASNLGKLTALGTHNFSGGSSVITLHLGETFGGNVVFDFSEFDPIWSMLRVIFSLMFGWISLRIILLKR